MRPSVYARSPQDEWAQGCADVSGQVVRPRQLGWNGKRERPLDVHYGRT